MKHFYPIFPVLLVLTVLLGCASESPVPETTALPAQQETIADAQTEPICATMPPPVISQQPPAPAVSIVLQPEASGENVEENEFAQVDYSHTEDGYLMVRYTAETDKRLKVLINGPSATYTYNLPAQQWTVFPLSDGNGTYQIGIYENIVDSRYAKVLAFSCEVSLLDEFAPFLRPNQYVNFSADSQAVALGAELTREQTDPLKKVETVYDYVVAALRYDDEKAAAVQSGYLPDLDQILQDGKGICFDYAAVMTAMLRSQEIPCKLVVGYAGTVYHAWISVWTEESGWVDGAIFFDGHQWQRLDPTYASTALEDASVLDFIRNGTYTAKYLY